MDANGSCDVCRKQPSEFPVAEMDQFEKPITSSRFNFVQFMLINKVVYH